MSRQEQSDREFQQFVTANRGRLLGIARKLLADDAEAEDVLQDTLLAVLAKVRAGEVDDVARYTRRAVRINALKRRAWRSIDAPLGESTAATVADGNDDFEIDPTELERAIAELPPLQQATIRMRYYTGMTFKEIGEALSVSMNTAASRCRYALAKLRTILSKRRE